jgi:cell division protein FtsI/penicillin-binding protein 2
MAQRLTAERRRRMLRRTVPIVAVCSSAFAAGVVVATRGDDPEEALVARFVRAWEAGDHAAMHRDLSDEARRRTPLLSFARTYRTASDTATASAVVAGPPRREGDAFVVPVTVRTRIFGAVRARVRLGLEGAGGDARIAWDRSLAFPGLRPGETLTRNTRMPPRGTILARDRTVLAKGSDRSSAAPDVARNVVGILGPIQADRREALTALGFPADAEVGQNGLERALDMQLAGRPGGELLAGDRVLARSEPRRAEAVRTTVSPPIERAVVAALGARLGGIVAVRPRTGEVLAFAGIAFSGLQPPGSTFKIVTLTGALEAGIAKPSTQYPVQTSTVLSGVELQNANGESCGGTLAQSFAHSCNSVFAPLGARLGAERLVEVAERFGFNRAPDVPGAATSTIPTPDQIGDELAVGSTAIGQGRVQASALQMAGVAATIGLRGRRPKLTLELPPASRRTVTTRVTSPEVARTVERMMLGVVRAGTGTAAAIAGVRVAGKTGTAELKTTTECEPLPDNPEACPDIPSNDPTDTDAWFAAYAPAGDGRPRIAVGVMLVQAGAGGDTAAPAARQVLLAGLKR